MEGWRQRRLGSNRKNPQEGKEKQEKKRLTHTGLLMEGVSQPLNNLMPRKFPGDMIAAC
jgi:hypothetical protein